MATTSLQFPSLITMSDSLLSLLLVACLLEPEEITSVAQGKISQSELFNMLPSRLPGGGNFSTQRLNRALSVHNSEDELKKFYDVFTGKPITG